MISNRLRKAVLQAAMEGKLTEQLSDDGNAIEYITEYKIKKLNDIADFPKIPKSWIYTNLGEIGIWKAGSTPLRSKTEYYQNGKIPWLKTGDLNNGIIYDIPECITEKALNETSLKLNPVGSILMAMYGATIGKLGILGIEATTNQACIACITKDFVYNKFLFYYLYSEQDKFIKKGVGGAQPNISREKIVATEFPLPPIEEQKRIVEKLEVLLAEIDKLEQDEKALKELEDKFPERLKSAIIESAMKGKITNQDLNDNSVVEILTKIEINKGIKFRVINEDEKPYSIPMNWVWISHNDILEISGGSQPPKSTSELPKENYIRLYQIRDYGSNPQPVYIPIETATKQTKKGDILLARYGASLGKVFYAEEGAYNVAMAKVIPLFKEDILYNDFLFYYYKSSQYQSLVLKNTRSAQAGFNKNDLNKLLIALPPIEEQKRIVDKLDKLFQLNFMIK
jgi:type I restriction enzyme S subunit